MTTIDVIPPPLPSGATGSTGWEIDEGDPSRVICGDARGADGHDLTVQLSAIQYQDGRLDTVREPPSVYIDGFGDCGLSIVQTRAFAALLTEAADELDRWLVEEGPHTTAPAEVRTEKPSSRTISVPQQDGDSEQSR